MVDQYSTGRVCLAKTLSYQASLRSRDAFWDIPVTKTHSTFDSLIVPRPPCVRAATPHHRKLGAGYAALPQWLDATIGCDLCLPSGAQAHAG